MNGGGDAPPPRRLAGVGKTLLQEHIYDRVTERWQEFGFREAPPRLTVFHKD